MNVTDNYVISGVRVDQARKEVEAWLKKIKIVR